MLYRTVAYLYNKLGYGLVLVNRLRRNILLPLSHWGGRDMFLLRNGTWVDRSPYIPESEVAWCYSSETHTITNGRSDRTSPWEWLSAIDANGQDISDFFGTLRLTRGQDLSADKVLMLFVHQKGWMPTGPLRVMNSVGEEQQVNAVTGALIPAAEEVVANVIQRVESINHIS